MHRYDADRAPVAEEWLDSDEDERVEAVERYHLVRHVELPDLHIHAVMHTIAENQVALREDATVRALRRLMAEGLTRHDAIHAIAAVNINFIFKTLRGEADWPEEDTNRLIREALDELTAEKWLSGGVNGD
jgi:hypothetical protein